MKPSLAKRYATAVYSARGWDYRPALEELEGLEWASPEVVEARRLEKLRSLLAHCHQQVPFYRREFEALGLHPSDIRNEDDLTALPVVTKQLLLDRYDDFMSADDSHHDVWVSSGSTGRPFPFRLDKRSIAANLFAALIRSIRWWGIELGTPQAMIWSGVRDVSGALPGRLAAFRRRLSWRLQNIWLIDVYSLNPRKVGRAYRSLLKFRPEYVRAHSSGLFRFCLILQQLGLDGRQLGIRIAIYTGECFPAAQQELVERVLGCKTVCEYGCSELGIIAFECPSGGLHVHHENLLLEYRVDGRRARPGEQAELIVTNLNARTVPLVRYSVGDLVVPSEAACPCGRTLPTIEGVVGRTYDQIWTPEGATVHGLFFTHLFDRMRSVQQFRVVQEEIDSLRIELLSTATITNPEKAHLRRTVQAEMGPNVHIEIEQVETLELSASGKLRWIVSNVKPPA